MLVGRPSLLRVRLELGRAFFLKGEDRLARRHFEQVLAGKPPAAVALNVNRFLNQIRARKRWSVRVGAALAPDSNIGAGSDERTIYRSPFGGQRLPFLPRRGGADHLGHRHLGLARRRVPVPAGRPRNGVRGKQLAAAARRRPLAPGIQGEYQMTVAGHVERSTG